jgi:hypothetical protein
VLVLDAAALGTETITFDNATAPFLECPTFGIECRVYRAIGAEITEVFGDALTLKIHDPLGRTHRYVHWVHEVYTPQVRVDSNGSRTILGYDIKTRSSRIHRTDLPGRCKFASHFSIQKIRESGPFVTDPFIEYLDELPFPTDVLVQNRKKVCDYCFFGGPTKDVPLIS